MAFGIPVVSTVHAGIPEAVSDGLSGLLVPEGDTTLMAEKIRRLSLDPQLRIKLGDEARRVALERFSWHRERTDLIQTMGLSQLTTDPTHQHT